MIKQEGLNGRFSVSGYIRLWFTAYINPVRFAAGLKNKPAPLWGFLASLQRALMDSLFLYLPVALMGRIPPEPSYLSFIADENYYFALVGFAAPVLLAEWLLGGAVIYMILRACRFKSGFDQILNITGFIALMIGSVLLVWDWIWIAVGGIGAGGLNQYWLGISHLVIDLWGIAVAAVVFKRILKVPVWLGALVNLAAIIAALPMAIMFMRSPL